MTETLVSLISREIECRNRIAEHDTNATAERDLLEKDLFDVRNQIGCAKAGLDNDWIATGKCAAYRGLDASDFGTKDYDAWAGQRSDHEWGGPRHGSIVFKIGLKDRSRELTEEERADAIYFLLNIEAWENARVAAGAPSPTGRSSAAR